MAIINTSYGSIAYLRVINISYDNVAHTVTAGSITDTVIPSGVGEGVEIYRQDGVDEYWSVRASNSAPYAYVVHVVVSDSLPCDLEVVSVSKVLNLDGSYNITINSSGSGTKRFSYGAGTPQQQISNVFNNVPPGTYYAQVTRTEDSCYDNLIFTLDVIGNLVVYVEAFPVSAFGAADGKAIVHIDNGSGNIEYEWIIDAVSGVFNQPTPYTFQRSNFVTGIYFVHVKDVVKNQEGTFQFTIGSPPDPNPQPNPDTIGKYFKVPAMNSLQFVVKDIEIDPNTNPAGLDNQLLCEQEFEGYEPIKYFQKVNRPDNPVVQIHSDFQNNSVELRKASDDSTVKVYGATLKEHNVGVLTQYAITIRNSTTPGKTRVQFNSGDLEVPLEAGDSFEILNNVDGFNGVYVVLEVIYDELVNVSYFLINKNYGLVASTSVGDGKFASNLTDYNVYETVIDLSGVADGEYYVWIKPNNVAVPSNLYAVSEPVSVTESHYNTVLVSCKCVDNAFDVTWTTGYLCQIRLDAWFGDDRKGGGVRSTTRSSSYKLIKINAKKARNIIFKNKKGRPVPPWMIEKLDTAMDCDFIALNNVQVQTDKELDASKIEDSLWNNFSISVEALGWYDKYNSTDTGTLSDGGLILSNTGFIKYR